MNYLCLGIKAIFWDQTWFKVDKSFKGKERDEPAWIEPEAE